MVAPFVRPFSISTATAAILVSIESFFLGSLPTLALAATFVGPFIPLITSGWSHRRATTQDDVQLVYEPLYKEIVKNRQQILSAKTWGQLPMFQRQEIDQIQLGARYSLLKSQTPAVEQLIKSIDFIFGNQGPANRSASRIITETIQGNLSILRYAGDSIGFRGKTKEGSELSVDSSWTPTMLIQGLDPLDHYRRQGFTMTSMGIIERNNVIIGQLELPTEEPKYRFFWNIVEQKAREDEQIKKMRSALSAVANFASEAEKQVLDKIKKSRSSF